MRQHTHTHSPSCTCTHTLSLLHMHMHTHSLFLLGNSKRNVWKRGWQWGDCERLGLSYKTSTDCSIEENVRFEKTILLKAAVFSALWCPFVTQKLNLLAILATLTLLRSVKRSCRWHEKPFRSKFNDKGGIKSHPGDENREDFLRIFVLAFISTQRNYCVTSKTSQIGCCCCHWGGGAITWTSSSIRERWPLCS